MAEKKSILLYDRILTYKNQDEFGLVEIVENAEYRSLHFGSVAKQSEMLINDPFTLVIEYTQLMVMSLLFHSNPQSVLILGVGGGSVAKFIWKHYPNCTLDLVERSSLVAELAVEYFSLPVNDRLKIHFMDAAEYLEKTQKKYDLVFIDIFVGDGISSLVEDPSFFISCKKLMKDEQSILVWNTWSTSPRDLVEKSVVHLAEAFGSEMLILPDKNKWKNLVFLVFSHRIKDYPIATLIERAQQLHEKTGLDFPKLLSDLNFLNGYGL